MKRILFVLFVMLACSSCSNDGRKVKKFLSRMNAREFNAASLYIYPGDYAKLSLYTDVLRKNSNTFLKLANKRNIKINGTKGVAVEFQCLNTTPYYRNYMESLGLLTSSGMIRDTFLVRQTTKGKKLSFDWARIKGENLELASIRDTTIHSMNIRSGMGIQYPVVGQLESGRSVIIDNYSENPEWVKCFTIDDHCNPIEGYIYRNSLSIEQEFFPLGLFESFGLLVAVVILVVLGFVVVYGHALIQALFSIPWLGWLLAVGLILGLLYTIYQLLEKILFELFIINLPY